MQKSMRDKKILQNIPLKEIHFPEDDSISYLDEENPALKETFAYQISKCLGKVHLLPRYI